MITVLQPNNVEMVWSYFESGEGWFSKICEYEMEAIRPKDRLKAILQKVVDKDFGSL